MKQYLTELGAVEYVDSLKILSAPTEVYASDGGWLWRVSSQHYVLLVCLAEAHGAHRGPEALTKVLAREHPGWVCFATFVNPDQEFEAQHYGPAWDEKVTVSC